MLEEISARSVSRLRTALDDLVLMVEFEKNKSGKGEKKVEQGFAFKVSCLIFAPPPSSEKTAAANRPQPHPC